MQVTGKYAQFASKNQFWLEYIGYSYKQCGVFEIINIFLMTVWNIVNMIASIIYEKIDRIAWHSHKSTKFVKLRLKLWPEMIVTISEKNYLKMN